MSVSPCRISLEVEVISIDELYLNASKVLDKCRSGSGSSLAQFLRKAIEVINLEFVLII